LGHIFEQSISDLEAIKSLSEDELTGKVKVENKRKKDGVYYTPEYIVDYIVQNSLGKYLEDKEFEILAKYNLQDGRLKDKGYDKKIVKAYEEYMIWIRDIKILDPACGSGAFLVKVFDYLLAEHKRVYRIVNDAQGNTINSAFLSDDDYIKPILEKNIYGVDLNPESVEITKLSLWLKSAKKGKKLITLKGNIKCGNSLVSNKDIAGERAFDWQTEFKEIFDTGGFDVIVGNPPYVQLSKVSTTTENEKQYLLEKYNTSGGRLNTFIFFIHLAKSFLKDNGYLSYIIPNTLLTQEYYKDTRKLLVEDMSLTQIVSYPNMPFADAVVENITFIAKKTELDDIEILNQTPEDTKSLGKILKKEINEKNKYLIDIRNNKIVKKIDNLELPLLNNLVNINQAIALKGDKKLSVKDSYSDGYYKLIDGRNIGRYYIVWTGKYLEYDLSRIHSCKKKDIFLKPKLLFRRVSANLVFTYDDKDYFALNTLVVLTPKKDDVELKLLLAVLNSKLVNYYYVNKYKSTKKVFSEIQARTVGLIPIPEIDKDIKENLIKLSNNQLDYSNKFKQKLSQVLEMLRHELGLEKVNKKLESFDTLSFDEFIKIGSKEFSIDKKQELMSYFNKSKEDILNLKNEISRIDNEIDTLVYSIYGLDDGEVRIIS